MGPPLLTRLSAARGRVLSMMGPLESLIDKHVRPEHADELRLLLCAIMHRVIDLREESAELVELTSEVSEITRLFSADAPRER